MNLRLLALRFAVAATVCWTLKAVAIGTAGGLGRSPLEGPFFLAGLACAVATGLLAGASYAVGRGPAWKALGAVLGLVAGSVVGLLEARAVEALAPAHPSWAWEEAQLWVLCLTLLAVTGLRVHRARTGAIAPAPRTRVTV